MEISTAVALDADWKNHLRFLIFFFHLTKKTGLQVHPTTDMQFTESREEEEENDVTHGHPRVLVSATVWRVLEGRRRVSDAWKETMAEMTHTGARVYAEVEEGAFGKSAGTWLCLFSQHSRAKMEDGRWRSFPSRLLTRRWTGKRREFVVYSREAWRVSSLQDDLIFKWKLRSCKNNLKISKCQFGRVKSNFLRPVYTQMMFLLPRVPELQRGATFSAVCFCDFCPRRDSKSEHVITNLSALYVPKFAAGGVNLKSWRKQKRGENRRRRESASVLTPWSRSL